MTIVLATGYEVEIDDPESENHLLQAIIGEFLTPIERNYDLDTGLSLINS